MKQFYETYNGVDEKLSTLLRQISWSNNLAIMSRCKTYQERAFNLNLCAHDSLSYRQFECQIDRPFMNEILWVVQNSQQC